MSEVELYNEGSGFLANADIRRQSQYLKYLKLDFRFPHIHNSQYLIFAFAYYDFGQKDDTIAECDKFIDLYPNHPKVDYAYYMRALSNLEKNNPFFKKYWSRYLQI